MRAVIQKVSQSSVTVNGEKTGQIGQGLLVLLGVTHDDTQQDARYLAEKIANLRIFEDGADKLNLSVKDVDGDCRKGRRPSFTEAARPEQATVLYEQFNCFLEAEGVTVQTGRFQTHMEVALVNDGPVTILLDSRKHF